MQHQRRGPPPLPPLTQRVKASSLSPVRGSLRSGGEQIVTYICRSAPLLTKTHLHTDMGPPAHPCGTFHLT
ncbi:hypothetical protein E2C01_020908 [Portunus trituberculatus]|uniref:Uncharacterized protein n=1 Tax=Portunus trituberculatus TaxID=210409 RepID=A0A5B7E2V1_PORTR|nr:hypothetical protein [Portunus trituberculatus]